MTGFRSQVETETAGAFSGIGTKLAATVGLAVGGAAAFGIVKSSVTAASDIQKQMEIVRHEFGKAGEGLIKFADTTGVKLGDTNRATDAASGRFGLLFQSLGIGRQKAAEMTKGFEQLALSVNAIRGGGGQGAATLLNQIVLAAAGNTRGLKQMGIVVDATSEKYAAFKLGLIQNINQALTPAQKTQAIYAIATQHLGDTLNLAKKHLGDFANVQAHLSAEWVTAKEALGKALMPALTSALSSFTRWLHAMNQSGRLQKDFNGIIHATVTAIKLVVSAVRTGIAIWEGFSHAVGGVHNALKILLGILVVSKFAAIAGEVKKMGQAFTGPFVRGVNQGKASFTQFTTQVKARSAAMVATTKVDAAEMQSSIVGYYRNSAKAAATSFKSQEELVAAWSTATKAETIGVRARFAGMFTSIKAGATTAFTSVEAVGIASLTAIKGAFLSLFAVAWPLLIGTAVAYAITHWETVKKYTLALVHASIVAFKGMGNIIVGVYQYIYGKALYYIVSLAKHALDLLSSAAGWLPFVGGKIQAAARAVDAFAGSTHKFAEDGRRRLIGGFHDITHGVTQAWSNALAASVNDPKGKANAKKAGQNAAQNFNQGLQQTLTQTAPATAQVLNDTLQKAIQAAHQKIQQTIRDAKNNLDKIGGDLAKTIDAIQKKIGGAVGSVAGSPQGQAFEKLKKLIESGAPSFEIAKAQAALSGQLQNAGKTQQSQVQTQLADLTARFNTGKISDKQFVADLHKILKEDGISIGAAMKAGGKSFADTYKAQVAALKAQAAAIAAVPAKLRGIGGAGGAADIKIIKPLDTIRQEAKTVAIAASRQRAEQIKQAAAIAKNTAKTAAATAQAAQYGVKLLPSTPGQAPQTVTRFLGARLAHAASTSKGPVATRPRAAPDAQQQIARLQARVNRLLAAFESSSTPRLQRQLEAAQRQLKEAKAQAAAQSHLPATRGARVTPGHLTSVGGSIVRALREVRSDVLRADKDIVGAVERVRVAVRQAPRQPKPAPILLPSLRATPRRVPHVTPAEVTRSTTEIVRSLQNVCAEVAAGDRRIAAAVSAPRTRTPRVTTGQFAAATNAILRSLRALATDVLQADKDIVAAELQTRTPVENLRRATLRVANDASRQRDRLIMEGHTTNSLLRKLNRTHGPSPGFHKQPKGAGSQQARRNNQIGVRA